VRKELIYNEIQPNYVVDLVVNIIKKGAFKSQNFSQEFSDRFGGDLMNHIIEKFRSLLEDKSQ